MTIDINIQGTKKEIEQFLKVRMNDNFKKSLPKGMSKILDRDMLLERMECRSSAEMRDVPRYTVSFSHHGYKLIKPKKTK